MKTIFFDLETTDLNFVGQILNYAFVLVDGDWKTLDVLRGNIKISNVQLPSIYAILANRVDVIEHQQIAEDTEPQAMAKIRAWLDNILENSKDPVKLIGYNSVKFDVPFLRTSMIRNGINPYHPNLKLADLLHVAQKTATVNPSFQAMLGPNKSLKLDRLVQLANISTEKQKHESLADVLITIELAKHFAANYGLDVRTYQEYEAKKHEKGAIVIKAFPEKDAKYHQDEYTNNKTKARLVCLDYDKNYSLWIDIDDWAAGKGRDSISWYAKGHSTFFVSGIDNSDEAQDLALHAKEDLGIFNLKNFFPERNCDIEQFIYMMKFDESGALTRAIWNNDTTSLKELRSKYGSKLYMRYLINQDPNVPESVIENYALYRYGGKLKTNKMDDKSVFVPGVFNPSFHTTYKELEQQAKKIATESTKEDSLLAQSLLFFYQQSPIVKIAGNKLLALPDRQQTILDDLPSHWYK